jgi:tetratricopeptide (TPR) repeat protein
VTDETPLAAALIAGDTEHAVSVLAQRLRAVAPSAIAYHDAVRAVVAAVVDGKAPQPVPDLYPLLGPFPVPGLPIAIDVRAGCNSRPDSMRQTYQALFGAEPDLGAVLVIVNTADEVPAQNPVAPSAGEILPQLREVAGRPVIWVGWRIGDPATSIAAGVSAACQRAVPQAVTQPRFAIPAQRRPPSSETSTSNDTSAWQDAADLHWRGQLQEAEQAYRTIVETRAKTLGREHPSTLAARDQHATVLRDLDRLAEALVECDEVLTTRIRVLGENHAEVLTSRSHLASIYHQLGDLTRAETEHGTVLAARTRLLGPDHPETLITRSNLAKLYQDLGELDRAIVEHEAVMAQRGKVLGPEHRDTLMSRSLLASALHLAGRLPEAAAAHREVLHGRLRLLGPAHLDTAVSRHRLAGVLYDLGQLEEAVEEYRAAREVYQSLLGSSSPFTRAVASDLALAERALR